MNSAEVAEVKRGFIVAERLEGWTQLRAEGPSDWTSTSAGSKSRVERRFGLMDRRFEETLAMIKFSQAGLDRWEAGQC